VERKSYVILSESQEVMRVKPVNLPRNEDVVDKSLLCRKDEAIAKYCCVSLPTARTSERMKKSSAQPRENKTSRECFDKSNT
jgi:hypothetical protein